MQLLLTLCSLFCVLAADLSALITFVESLSDLLTMANKHWLVAYLNITISGRYSWAYLISETRQDGWDRKFPEKSNLCKFGITENLACLRPEIKHSSSVATQNFHPGMEVLRTVHLAIAWWGRGYTNNVLRMCWPRLRHSEVTYPLVYLLSSIFKPEAEA